MSAFLQLVNTLSGGHGLALGLVQGMADVLSVAKLDLVTALLVPREGVLHPVDVVTLGVVLAGVGTTRLLTGGSTVGGLHGASEQVLELQALGQVGVPDHGAVLGADVLEVAVNTGHVLNTAVERLLHTEDADIGLHGALHVLADGGGGAGTSGGSDEVEVLDGLLADVLGALGQSLAGGLGVLDTHLDGTTEHDQVKQRVGTKTVGTVDRDTGGLTAGVQTGNGLVVALSILGQDLTVVVGGDTTHVVVDSGQDGDGLLGDVNTSEDLRSLGDTGQSLVENLSRQVRELEEEMVLLGANTTAVTDLHGHGTTDDITRGQILGSGSVTLHETLTLGVEEVATLTTRALGDQTTGTVDTGRVELHELQVLEGQTSTRDHGVTVTGTGVGGSGREVGSAVATSGNDGVVGEETVESTVLLVVSDHTAALTVLHEKVHGEVLDEELGVVTQTLTIKGVEQSMASTVGHGTGTVGLTALTELLALTTEGTLVDAALVGSGEGDTEVLELDDGRRSLTSHVVDGVLVTEPVGALDGVVHVPVPVILVHVSQGSVDTTLGSNGVGTSGEQLGDTGGVEAVLGQAEGSAETRTTGAHHHSVVLVVDDAVFVAQMLGSVLTLDVVEGKLGIALRNRVEATQLAAELAAKHFVEMEEVWRNKSTPIGCYSRDTARALGQR